MASSQKYLFYYHDNSHNEVLTQNPGLIMADKLPGKNIFQQTNIHANMFNLNSKII